MRIVIAVLCLLICATAAGQGSQNAVLLRADTLRAEPFADAAAVSQAAAGIPLRVLEKKGTWSLVEAGGKRGWLRSLNLKAEGAGGVKREGVLALETGRQAQGGIAVPLAIRNVPIPGFAARVLEDLFAGRDSARPVRLTLRRAADGAFSLELQSPRPGYAYVFMAGNAGDALHCLFPNAVQPDNEVAADKAISLPAGGWRIGLEGVGRLVAVVTDAPLDLMLEDKQAEGPLFKVSVNNDNRAAVAQALSGGSRYAAAAVSVTLETRTPESKR